jgi:predicted nucleic acid-binding protein
MTPVTLDTGALIAIERRRPRGVMLLQAALEHRVELLVPSVVHAEWWRGRTDVRDRIKKAVTIVPLPIAVAEAAGVALGAIAEVRRAGLAVDVMVMAFSAVVGGGVIYTSDVGDLQRIAPRFPSVRVLAV